MTDQQSIVHEIRNLSRDPYGHFPPVPCGKYHVSVQASASHYCDPRNAQFDMLGLYDEVEAAVLVRLGERGADIDYRFTGGDVGGYLTWDQVAELVADVLADSPRYPDAKED